MVLPKVTETWAWNSSSRNFLKKFFEIKSLTQFSSHNLTSTLQLKTRTSLAASQSEWEKQPATRSFSHKYCCGNWQILWPKKTLWRKGEALLFNEFAKSNFQHVWEGSRFSGLYFIADNLTDLQREKQVCIVQGRLSAMTKMLSICAFLYRSHQAHSATEPWKCS